jgi:hypothetical protein
MIISLFRRNAGFGLATLLASCGGSGMAGSMLPATTVNSSSVAGPQASAAGPQVMSESHKLSTTPVSIRIAVPSLRTESLSRSLKYISSATKSAAIVVSSATQGTQTVNVNCTNTCAATVPVPVGVAQFHITLYDGTNASGNVLSSGSASATITAAAANTVSIAFAGVPAKLVLNLTPSTWTPGTAASSTVTVTAYDAAGNMIIGAQNYSTPITLSSSDTSGAASLSQKSIASPSATATLKYSGASSLSSETLTASVGSLTANAQVAIAQSAGGTQSVAQTHIMTFEQSLNSGSLAKTAFSGNHAGIGAYLTYALTDPASSSSLHAGGVKTGFYATVHTICVPQTFGQCTPQASEAPDVVFATTCSGDRVTFSTPTSGLVQYQTDPAQSGPLATLFNSVIATNTASGQYDFVFDDNSNLPGDTLGWQKWYDYTTGQPNSPLPYCNYSNTEYINGMRALYANLRLPVIANALNVPDTAPAASGALQYFTGVPNLWGAMLEGIYGSSWNGPSRNKESGNIWQSEENTQLATSNAHRLFVGFEHVGGTDAAGLDQRLYIYASLMLSFDNASLVLSEDGMTTPSNVNVNPEAQLVPLQPLIPQPSTIGALAQGGGSYAREFAACYYAGNSIGPCASVVNSNSSATVPFPTLSRHYGHTAVISGAGIVPNVDNGTMTFTGSAPPSQLAPEEGVIVAG